RPADHRALPSFPTRRSSDLEEERRQQYPHRVPPPEDHGGQGDETEPGGHALVEVGGGQQREVRAADPGYRPGEEHVAVAQPQHPDRKSTRLNSSHVKISYAV